MYQVLQFKGCIISAIQKVSLPAVEEAKEEAEKERFTSAEGSHD